MRLCARNGCASPAGASMRFEYASRTAWIDGLDGDPSPDAYDLCPSHAERFTVPVGWEREDRRPAAPALFPARAS